MYEEQSSQMRDDSVQLQPMAPMAAKTGRETACCDLSMNNQSEETTSNVKEENLYSEIASTSQPGVDVAAMDRKSETTYGEVRCTREPIKGAGLGQAVGGVLERTGVLPEEALYDQPVCPPYLYTDNKELIIVSNCQLIEDTVNCNCLHCKIYSSFAPGVCPGLFTCNLLVITFITRVNIKFSSYVCTCLVSMPDRSLCV